MICGYGLKVSLEIILSFSLFQGRFFVVTTTNTTTTMKWLWSPKYFDGMRFREDVEDRFC